MDLIDVKFPQPDKERLLRGLLTFLPRESVLHQIEELRPYECDVVPDALKDKVPAAASKAGPWPSKQQAYPAEDSVLAKAIDKNQPWISVGDRFVAHR